MDDEELNTVEENDEFDEWKELLDPPIEDKPEYEPSEGMDLDSIDFADDDDMDESFGDEYDLEMDIEEDDDFGNIDFDDDDFFD